MILETKKYCVPLNLPKTLADFLEEYTGRRVGAGPFQSDIIKALEANISRIEAKMRADMAKELYPCGREIYVQEFNKRFGL